MRRRHSAATTPRRPSVSSPPTLRVPYARPPLSKEFLRGDSDDVALHPAEWYAEHRIDLVHARVERIDPHGRFVIADGQRHPYGALILASGVDTHPASGAGR